MTTPPPDPNQRHRFRDLLNRLADGEQTASETIVNEYGTHILRAVRRRMNQTIRDRFDSEDFAQAVWASFFGNLSVVGRIENENDLAGFLTRMASNKVIDAGRRQKVRPARNASEEGIPEVVKDNRRKVSQPTPSQFAVANEQWDHLNLDEDERHRRMLELLLSGASRQEIAEAMGVSERHLRRVLSRFSRKQSREENDE